MTAMNVYVDVTNSTKGEQLHLRNMAARRGFKRWSYVLPNHNTLNFDTLSDDMVTEGILTDPEPSDIITPAEFEAGKYNEEGPATVLKRPEELYNTPKDTQPLTVEEQKLINRLVKKANKSGDKSITFYDLGKSYGPIYGTMYIKLGDPNVVSFLSKHGYRVKDYPSIPEVINELSFSYIAPSAAYRVLLW